MNITEILQKAKNGETIIQYLQRVAKSPKDIRSKGVNFTTDKSKRGANQYYVGKHEIFDPAKRPDKIVKATDEDNQESTRVEKVNRIGIALQEKIVKTAVAFLFGNPVNISSNTADGTEELFQTFKKIMEDNKINSMNRELAKNLFRSKEIAEIWYLADVKPNKKYGFQTDQRIKILITSSWEGNEYYPLFDEMGNMIAFGRSHTVASIEYFEVYTDEQYIRFEKKEKGFWTEVVNQDHGFGKIPVIYAKQEFYEWENVQTAIDRLEKLFSNFGDTTDYHSSPTMVIKGDIEGLFSKKAETGKVLQIGRESDVKYASWDNAPEAIRLEIDQLYKIIYSMSNTPDLSFENLKTLSVGSLSGKVLEFLFLDANLKVMEKQGIFDAYLDRRTSVVLSLIASINQKFESATETIEIKSEIMPFTFHDKQADLDYLMQATGEKPILSVRTAVQLSGITSNPDEELARLEEERESERATTDPPVTE